VVVVVMAVVVKIAGRSEVWVEMEMMCDVV
jgi:hypothetical protein